MALGDGSKKFGFSRLGMGLDEQREAESKFRGDQAAARTFRAAERMGRRAYKDAARRGDTLGAYNVMKDMQKSGYGAVGNYAAGEAEGLVGGRLDRKLNNLTRGTAGNPATPGLDSNPARAAAGAKAWDSDNNGIPNSLQRIQDGTGVNPTTGSTIQPLGSGPLSAALSTSFSGPSTVDYDGSLSPLLSKAASPNGGQFSFDEKLAATQGAIHNQVKEQPQSPMAELAMRISGKLPNDAVMSPDEMQRSRSPLNKYSNPEIDVSSQKSDVSYTSSSGLLDRIKQKEDLDASNLKNLKDTLAFKSDAIKWSDNEKANNFNVESSKKKRPSALELFKSGSGIMINSLMSGIDDFRRIDSSRKI